MSDDENSGNVGDDDTVDGEDLNDEDQENEEEDSDEEDSSSEEESDFLSEEDEDGSEDDDESENEEDDEDDSPEEDDERIEDGDGDDERDGDDDEKSDAPKGPVADAAKRRKNIKSESTAEPPESQKGGKEKKHTPDAETGKVAAAGNAAGKDSGATNAKESSAKAPENPKVERGKSTKAEPLPTESQKSAADAATPAAGAAKAQTAAKAAGEATKAQEKEEAGRKASDDLTDRVKVADEDDASEEASAAQEREPSGENQAQSSATKANAPAAEKKAPVPAGAVPPQQQASVAEKAPVPAVSPQQQAPAAPKSQPPQPSAAQQNPPEAHPTGAEIPKPVVPPAGQAAKPIGPQAVDALGVTLTFETARKSVTVGELRSIHPGYTFICQNPANSTVEIRANGHLIGYGKLVSVENSIGVQIMEINQHG